MTEYWKSQENHFCKYCKCWVNDNPISRQIHDNGKRHKEAVEDKLSDMRKKQQADAKNTKDEQHWLKKMEEAALKDYKKKDIGSNRDFTAKLYNNEDLPDIDEKYESIRQANQVGPRLPGEPEPKHQKFEHMLKAGTESADKDIMIAPRKATISGTKWHNPPPPKYWYEAKNEDGHSYYWHTNTKESRWDSPPDGYVSIEEQEELQNKKEEKKFKKAKIIREQKEKFTPKPETEAKPEKIDAYGGRGWQTVEAPAPTPKVNLGLPEQRPDKYTPVIQAVPDRQITFKEKTIGSLGGDSSSDGAGSKPAIVFRKRKNQSIRQRGED